jgi:hypothetical protein
MSIVQSLTKRWYIPRPDALPNADPLYVVEADTRFDSIELRSADWGGARISGVLDPSNTQFDDLVSTIHEARIWLGQQANAYLKAQPHE